MMPLAGLDGALLPLGVATMLPEAAHTSNEVLAWERRHLFAGTWTCLGRTDELFPAEVADPSYAVDFWDLTNRQDWAACESVQRGVASPHYRPGPLAPNEDAVHTWVGLVARAYRDPLAEFGPAGVG